MEYVLSFAQEKLKYELSNIILWGFSLGTGPTIEIAARFQNIGGVILQSPLASLMIWMDKKATANYQYSTDDMYCSINKIETIRAKIFIIHGKRDRTIDVRHSNLLYEKYVNFSKENNQIWLVLAEGVGHNDIQFLIEDDGGIFFKRIHKFIELVKYPLLLIEASLFMHKRARAIKEESKRGYLEKETKSLKISFDMLQINEYSNPFLYQAKNHLFSQSTGVSINEELSKTEDYFLENIENSFAHGLQTQSLPAKKGKRSSIKSTVTVSIGEKSEEAENERRKSWSMYGMMEQKKKEKAEGIEIYRGVEDFKVCLKAKYF